MVKIYFYKILCRETNKCYIGSTNNPNSRFNKHKSDYKMYLEGKINKSPTSSFEIMKNNNYEFLILEEKTFSTLEELTDRYKIERKYIEESENCINHNIPSQSVKERKQKYYLKNRENILIKVKKYQNKIKILLI